MRKLAARVVLFLSLSVAACLCGPTHTSAQEPFTDIGVGLTGVRNCSLAWGDFDNDGDLDLALAGQVGGLNYLSKVYRNDAGTFADIGAGLTGVYECSIAWGDYDSDGDLDLALAGRTDDIPPRVSKVYRNDGGTFTDIGAGLTGVWSCSVAWGDYDSDGDLDLALSGDDGTVGKVTKVCRNDAGTFTDIAAGLTGARRSSLTWGDYDDDGDLDLALAGYPGGGNDVSKIYRNDGGVFNTPPSAPTGFWTSVSGSGPCDVTFSWNAATDAETPQAGLTYNLRVGTTPGGNEIMSGQAAVGGSGDGKRLIPAMGNCQHNTSWTLKGLRAGPCYWSVQAIDTAFAGSPWAADASVIVPGYVVHAPKGGETWYYQGPDQDITWTSFGVAGNLDIHYSPDGGTTWTAIAVDIGDAGLYAWTVPNEDSPQCLVRIQETGGAGLSAVSGAAFTIPQKRISLTVPATAAEGDGTLWGRGAVSIPGIWVTDLVIDLNSCDTTELAVPATVTVLQGHTSATFDLTIEHDGEHDGMQTVTVTASASGWITGLADIDIHDTDPAPSDNGCVPVVGNPAALTFPLLAAWFVLRRVRQALVGV